VAAIPLFRTAGKILILQVPDLRIGILKGTSKTPII
jgi:hypothetical protein